MNFTLYLAWRAAAIDLVLRYYSAAEFEAVMVQPSPAPTTVNYDRLEQRGRIPLWSGQYAHILPPPFQEDTVK